MQLTSFIQNLYNPREIFHGSLFILSSNLIVLSLSEIFKFLNILPIWLNIVPIWAVFEKGYNIHASAKRFVKYFGKFYSASTIFLFSLHPVCNVVS